MNQGAWQVKSKNGKGERSGKRRIRWPGILLAPVVLLGALGLVMALSGGDSLAFQDRGWQKSSLSPVVDTYAPDHHPAWGRLPGRLGGDDDDDEDDVDEGSS